ncbi:FAD-dependent oxidoreductase [Micromonospora sp. CA-263727]|uniref:FAD-dependent oxidoreductase n=1 Tax=Micromonospora sp. CA-263727 TaxID=3239967 RepID=UPI003D8E9D03
MRIVVVGAGIGGLAAALGLGAAGHQVEVYERGDRLRTEGNGVILWPGATGILDALGIRVAELGPAMHRGELLTSDGSLLVWTDMREVSARYGQDTLLVSRGRVVEVLGAALPAGTVRFGRRCTEVRHRADGATVVFSDGTEVDADVVIGADGYRSAVRSRTLGDAPRFTGVATWHGTGLLRSDLAGGHTVRTYFGRIGICAVHPVGDGLLHWAFEGPWSPGDEAEGRAAGPQLPRLRGWFGGWAPEVTGLLDQVTEEDVHVFPHALHRVPRRWGQGAVTLMGDAAHAIPPRAGMGANQALEDAWVLAGALRDVREPRLADAALRAYESARVRRVRRVRNGAAWMSRSNNMLLMLRALRVAVPMNRLAHASVAGGSNYLNSHRPKPVTTSS